MWTRCRFCRENGRPYSRLPTCSQHVTLTHRWGQGVARSKDFFDERSDQSEVKSRIVAKFFASWSNVIINSAKRYSRTPRLAYVDLFSGPGRYLDGAKSTPLLIMEKVIDTPALADHIETTFNDREPGYAQSLKAALYAIPGIEKVRHPPNIFCDEVDHRIEEIFASAKMVPTFSFIDPFGYKGLTVKLIKAIGKDWGSDCIFFFNYRRINAAITNDNFRVHMDALFGPERVSRMRQAVKAMRPWRRVDYCVTMLAEVLKEHGFRYTIAFAFKDETGKRTTHALVYVTKDPKGVEIMKNIMASESSTSNHGVPSFEYNPAAAAASPQLDLSNPISDLAETLRRNYAGAQITVGALISDADPTALYLERNYKDAINRLESTGQIEVDPPAARRQRGGQVTCGPNVVLTFPAKKAA